MSQTGSLAANFHEGARSEYLALYALSALGMAATIPRQEDVGIDLQCALGERIGQRLAIDQYYLVQVKSGPDFGVYDSKESVRWLCAHRHPLFFVQVNKKGNKLEVFQTTQLVFLFSHNKVEKVTLIPSAKLPAFEYIPDVEKVQIDLGLPILSFDVAMIAKENWRRRARAVLRSWIELDQSNIDQKGLALGMFAFPASYKTNEIVKAGKLAGNFKDSTPMSNEPSPLASGLMKHVAVLIHRAAADRKIADYKILVGFVREYVAPHFLRKYSLWSMHLVLAINAGAERLSLPEYRLDVRLPDGTLLTPSMTVHG